MRKNAGLVVMAVAIVVLTWSGFDSPNWMHWVGAIIGIIGVRLALESTKEPDPGGGI